MVSPASGFAASPPIAAARRARPAASVEKRAVDLMPSRPARPAARAAATNWALSNDPQVICNVTNEIIGQIDNTRRPSISPS